MSFSDKVVVVTGASSGIGAATAICFSQEHANVVLVGRNETKLSNVVAECDKSGKKNLVIKADVSNDEDAKRIIDDTIKTFGKIDVLINNAGITRFGSILDGKILKAYDEVMSVNLRAVVNLTTLAAPHIVQTHGSIINISSINSQVPPSVPQNISYCVSKIGLEHFTRGAALELSVSGVRVNAIRPGPVRTDIMENSGFSGNWDRFYAKTALNRVSEPEEIANLAVYLASEKAKGITGSVFTCDNGYLLKKKCFHLPNFC